MCVTKNLPVIEMSNLSPYNGKDILVCRLSEYARTQTFFHLPHKHDFYQLIFLTEGGGCGSIDFRRLEICPFHIFFLVPGQVRVWDLTEDAEGYVINFSSSFFKTFLLNPEYVQQFPCFSGASQNAVIHLPEALQQDVWHLFRKINEEACNNERRSIDMIKVLMVQLFIGLSRHIANEQKEVILTSYHRTVLHKFLELIEKNVSVLRLPRQYAQLLFITPHHLNSICNEYLGRSTGEVIRDRMVLEAQRLMFNMDLSISEIAFKLDFNDQSYFSKFFKKYTGQAPEKFRRTLLDLQHNTVACAIKF